MAPSDYLIDAEPRRAVAITTTILWAAAFLRVMPFPKPEAISKHRFGSVAGVFWLYAFI